MAENGTQLYLENQLCFPLYAVSRLTTKLYGPLLKELGLTYPQYLVMLVLWQHGGQSVQQICDRLLLETNTVTPLLKRLEKQQLVVRQRAHHDERVVEVALTPQGDALRKRAATIPMQILAQFGGKDVEPAAILSLQSMLFELMNTLQQQLSGSALK
jgi:DNA-binding MarR family transcriptional regulator